MNVAARPGIGTWLLAIRPATLPASVSGVIVGLGAALAGGAAFRPDTALGCMAVALLLQVAANLANDLSDFRSGADNADRLGPTRVAAAGLISVRALTGAIVLVLGGAGVVGLWLAFLGGPAILILGAAAILALLGYTGGPFPYGYRGLGELFVFIFFGLVAVTATAELQSGRVEALYLLAAIPVGTLTTAILVVNNLRDTTTDRSAGKRTLAVMFGEGFARAEFVASLVAAWTVAAGLAAARFVDSAVGVGPTALLPFLALPMSVPLLRIVYREGDPRRLNPVLRGTARMTLVFAVLFGAGLALGR
jgi:1,4-dihydroxy-2-naphthoate polyprenyltransferase